jgi:hypothetical protein
MSYLITVTHPGQSAQIVNLHYRGLVGRAPASRPPPSPQFLYSWMEVEGWALARARRAFPDATVEARQYQAAAAADGRRRPPEPHWLR